jgi:hypothetical protein
VSSGISRYQPLSLLVQLTTHAIYFKEAGSCEARAIRWISHADIASDDHAVISAKCQDEAEKWAGDIEMAVSFSTQLERRILFIHPRLKDWTFHKIFVECIK